MIPQLRFFGVSALLFGTVALAGAEAGGGRPPAVVVDRPVLLQESAPARYVGMVEAIRGVDIMPRVTGTLLAIHFTEGGMVKEGDLLYELEDTTYLAAVDALKAQKEQLEAALHYAGVQFRRSAALRASHAVAETAHDKAVFDIAAAKAKVKEVAAALVDAENNLSYTRIRAPLAGRIGKSAFTAGNLITPQGGRLTDIAMVAPIYVRFSLSERIFRRDFGGNEGIRERAVVRIQLADRTLYGESARVTLIDNKIHPTTNTITLWATFENRDLQLIPGSFVTVLIAARQEKPFVAVTPSALVNEAGGACVYVLDDDNRAERRSVRAGNAANGLQIILDGLDGSERIVVDGTHKVRSGMTVTPVAPEAGE